MSEAMTPERWQKVKQVFQAALDLPQQDRSAYVRDVSAGDQKVATEVESLLRSEASAGAFLSGPAAAYVPEAMEEELPDANIGRPIGAYRIVREIGQGGMGTVYLAERIDHAFDKQVAIKLIQRGLGTESIIHRFRSERQILASLEHPNITRLLDGGTTEDGLQYFVMEYIQGERIDQYCEKGKLNLTERLRLFQSVCAAVHYAHQNLVIHRDIKPGNVLVTAEGVPRLLDFGIAKLIPGHTAETSGATITAVRLMTPEYASPEQVRGETVTTATDVYSLGVLLYELLTGRKPHQVTGKQLAEIERCICEEEAEKPSAAAGPVQGRRLRGDLDNIVRMAMRKEPQRRYGSVEQFSEDIRRHLDGLPVIARPDTAGYRVSKFVSRHKGSVAAAALLLSTLLVGTIAIAWQARMVAAERDRARVEAAKAERINGFLQNLLGFAGNNWASPNLAKADVKVSEVVESAAKRAEAELGSQPEVLAELRRTIGGIYSGQGRWDQAERFLRPSLDAYTKLYGPNHHEVARASHDLAVVLLRKGNTAEAERLFRKALDIYRGEAVHGHPDVPFLAGAMGDLGAMLGVKGDSRAAEAYLREGLHYAPQLSGQDRAIVAMMNNELAGLLYAKGDLKEVERLLRVAIDEYRKLPAGNYSELATSLTNLGAVLMRQGRYADAEPLVREGLEINRKVLGNLHLTTAGAIVHLSELLYAKNDYVGSERAAKEALQILDKTLPKGNLNFATPLAQLGLILNKTGRLREGEADLRQALAIRTRLLPAGHQGIASTEGALGECLTTERRYTEAEPVLLRSYAATKSNLGDQDPRTMESVRRLSTLYTSWNRPKEAARYQALLPPTRPAR